jgi:hypothetical protein
MGGGTKKKERGRSRGRAAEDKILLAELAAAAAAEKS